MPDLPFVIGDERVLKIVLIVTVFSGGLGKVD